MSLIQRYKDDGTFRHAPKLTISRWRFVEAQLDIADVDILCGVDLLDGARYIAIFLEKQGVVSGRVAFEPEISEHVGLQDLLAAVRETLEKWIDNKGAIFKKNGSPDADMDHKSSSGTMIHG